MPPHRLMFRFAVSLLAIAFTISTNPAAGQCQLQETQKLVASNAAPGDYFGYSVAISGNTIVVGAAFRNCTLGVGCGLVYVFRFTGNSWVEDAQLIPADSAASDYFGSNVAIEDDLIVIGSPSSDPNGISGAGAAYVFQFSGTAWVQVAKLVAADATQGDRFGGSVAVLNDRVFVGAPWKAYLATEGVGALYVFRQEGSKWIQEAKLVPPDICDQGMGYSVSAYGDRVLVGGDGFTCDGVASPPGVAQVFRREDTTWVHEATMPRPPGIFHTFGAAVSLSNDMAFVSFDYGAGMGAAAAVCRRTGTTWNLERVLGPVPGGPYSLATDGQTAVVARTVFDEDGNNWFGIGQLPAVSSASMHANHFVAGSPSEDNNGGVDAGAVYVYDVPHDCNSNHVADACDIAGGQSQDSNGNGIPDECLVAENIPALSNWGMLVITLVLLSAGMIVLHRRNATGLISVISR